MPSKNRRRKCKRSIDQEDFTRSDFKAYTNGGLELLDSQLNDHPTKYSDSNSFYELMNHAMQS
ncbi:hypothetical protein BMY_1156 [Wohlfahrtiimonas chitiniclastica]|nr:hypothetical protein BMY_1156 [Wohlfahrtiimonas chitiniclastica]